MLSRFVQEPDAPVHAIPQIKAFVKEANALVSECRKLIIVEGNHDERWLKSIGVNPVALRDAIGLSLREQCLAHGLSSTVQWHRESARSPSIRVGPYYLRHGHRQTGRFGSPRHLAANRLQKSMGVSEVFGHHHRAQMYCQSAHGRTAVAIANPCMTGDHDYAPDADWQRGFTILEMDQDEKWCTPHLILMTDGRFSWGGQIYDGHETIRRKRLRP